jgi:two-component system sensor histidine kinase CpxA
MKLFPKIFLCFWMTLVLTGVALILTFLLHHGSIPDRWHEMMDNTAHYLGDVAVDELERGGPAALAANLQQLSREGHLQACLFDDHANVIAGAQCDAFLMMAQWISTSHTAYIDTQFGISRAGLPLAGSDGRRFIFATELPVGPRTAFGAARSSFLLEWGVALAVSGLICYSLTRYLTAPILELRETARQFASGDLTTRVAAGMEHSRDELGRLVADFNAMADRIEELVSEQRQLIYDVSHELRSPLARLNVALDLVRERHGNDPALDQLEQDLECLNEMAGRLLTVARLDTSSAPIPFSRVNLQDVLSKIARDAGFESRQAEIKLAADEPQWVQGNPELLHSAIENVVRNAIRYTDEGAAIEIRLGSNGAASVNLTIRDHGPGIPEAELTNIFRPFYRVSNARDRQSGGVGLGLAIAERVIHLHHGTIRAENVLPKGLLVTITLPRLAGTTDDRLSSSVDGSDL